MWPRLNVNKSFLHYHRFLRFLSYVFMHVALKKSREKLSYLVNEKFDLRLIVFSTLMLGEVLGFPYDLVRLPKCVYPVLPHISPPIVIPSCNFVLI